MVNHFGVRDPPRGFEWETLDVIQSEGICFENKCPGTCVIGSKHIKVEGNHWVTIENYAGYNFTSKQMLEVVGAKPIMGILKMTDELIDLQRAGIIYILCYIDFGSSRCCWFTFYICKELYIALFIALLIRRNKK